MVAAFLTTILFSVSALFAQRTSRVLGGITANCWRMVLATLFLGAWSHAFGTGLKGDGLPWLFVSGIIGFGIGDVALFQALPRIGSRLTILLVHCLATPTAALVEYFWLHVALSMGQIACIAVSLFGVAFALAPGKQSGAKNPQFGLGLGFGLLAMLGQSLGAVLSRKASRVVLAGGHVLNGIDAAYQRAVGGVLVSLAVYAVYCYYRRSSPPFRFSSAEPNAPSPRTVLLWVLCNTLAGPVLGVSCFQWALSQAPTGLVLPIVALTPLVIIPFAHWMENEKTTWREMLGGAIAVAGVATLNYISHP